MDTHAFHQNEKGEPMHTSDLCKRYFFGILVLALGFGTAVARPKSEVFISKSGHLYDKRGHEWYVRMASDKQERQSRVCFERIIIQVDDSWTSQSLATSGVAASSDVSTPLPGRNFRVIEVPPDVDPFDYLHRVELSPGVRWARFDVYLKYYSTPNDPYFSLQWGLSLCSVPQAWDLASGGSAVKVGIIDSPIDDLGSGHPDLPNMTRLGGSEDPAFFHGTAVAGILFATKNNGIGMAGVAGGSATPYYWELPGTGVPSETTLAAGINAMRVAGVRVINLSLGMGNPSPIPFPLTRQAIDDAVAANTVIVCASGNVTGLPTDFPANYGTVIAVSALWTDGGAYGQSGPAVDIVAPGWADILTTDVRGCVEIDGSGGRDEGDYMCVEDNPLCDTCFGPCPFCFGGTSAAAPFVSGVAAMMLSVKPNLHWYEVRELLRSTADKLPGMNGQNYTQSYGYGRVNAAAAVAAALGATSIVYHGTITQNTTWSGFVHLDGDVMVAQGATLTIDEGTQIFFALTDAADLEPFFTDRVELHVRGTLVVNGTSTRPVVFKSESLAPTDHDWVHIQVLGGKLEMTHAEVRHAEWGIGGNTSQNQGVKITNCKFDSNQAADIRLFGNATGCKISDCTINVANGRGIEVNGVDGEISGNVITLTSSTTYGIQVDNDASSPLIENNQILGPTSQPYAAAGLILGHGVTDVKSNTIRGCTDGIQITHGDHDIGASNGGGNTITLTTNGIRVQCSIAAGSCPTCPGPIVKVRRNTITNSSVGILSGNGVIPLDVGTNGGSQAGRNTFTANDVCISNLSTCSTLMARGNYFGACPAPVCTTGTVDVNDPLCSPPTTSPAPQGTPTPTHTALLQNVPNPFNPTTQIRFQLADRIATKVDIFDVSGRLVRRADLGVREAGQHAWTWDGTNSNGNTVGSGIYFVTLRAGAFTDTRKIVMLK